MRYYWPLRTTAPVDALIEIAAAIGASPEPLCKGAKTSRLKLKLCTSNFNYENALFIKFQGISLQGCRVQ